MRFAVLAMLLLAAAGLVRAQPAEDVRPPAGGKLVMGDVVDRAQPAQAATGRMDIVDVADAPGFKKAMRFTIDKAGVPWSVLAGIPVPQDIAKDEAFLISYWVRTVETKHESQQGMLTVKIEETDSPHRGVAGGGITFPHEWTHFWARGKAGDNLAKGTVNFKIFAGEARQTVEIGGIEVYSYGVGFDVAKLPFSRMTYVGREPDAPWRKAAQERIEKLRMAPIAVKVIGRDGKPVPDAQVQIEQTDSAFGFGIEFSSRKVVDQTSAENALYRQKLPELFNTIVLGDMKWQPWLTEWGPEFSPEFTMGALKWAQQQGLRVRGHVMVWPGGSKDWGNLPKFMQNLKDKNPDPAALHELVLSHIDDIAEATAGYVDEWDVMNEPRDNHALIDLCGTPAMAEWFKRARQRLPQARLAVNEYSILSAVSDSPTHDTYEYYIGELLKHGAPLDTICMQGYFGMLVPTPERMLKTLDRFGKFGPMIRVTEYHIKGDDQDLMVDFTRDLITVLYSHEKVDGFNTWLGMPAFVNTDGSLTRLGQVYSDLVLKQWRTNQTLRTGADGTVEVPGHLGRYRITVKTPDGRGEEQWLTLTKDSPRVIITVR